ncbi:ABC transporter permease [Rhodohalobacter halophilus]|uniref:ABC transporter permease n=1 Tax=Rhodohalobacter halophilus TaxID=1812810 RepID=UPI00083F5C4F|nr:FtsX-like permease family protein [Rhodohalobacter halophilus]
MKLIRELFNPFSWKLAFRDARPQWKSLLLYTSAVIAGVAALVAILSFRNDVLLTVDDQSRELLGADLEVRMDQPYPEEIQSFFDTLDANRADAVEFNSMVIFTDEGQNRLSQIRAISGPYPMYGQIETLPANASQNYQRDGTALVEQSAMEQFNLQPGDTIQVGNIRVPISGELISVPGEAAAFSLIGPRIYLSRDLLEGSGLLDRGSRVTYKSYFQFENPELIASAVEGVRSFRGDHRIRYDTVETRKEDFDEIVSNLSRFLGLIAFVALLLGGLGVSSAVHVYLKRKTSMVATLRCIGMKAEQILASVAIQISMMGLAGAAIGTGIGLILQFYLPTLFTDLLPFEIVQAVSVQAIAMGLFTGILISVVFSLLPLAGVSTVSPMLTLRNADFSPIRSLSKKVKSVTVGATLLILILIIGLLTESFTVAAVFTLSMIAFVLLLRVTASFLMAGIKGFRLKSFTYVWRQGAANLFRPNNQTSMLMTTLGMGMLLIGTLYLSQDAILQRINLQFSDDMPNLVLYDIQTDQNEDILNIAEENGGRILQNVPIVSMRLAKWNGMTPTEVREDSTINVRGWALGREYRVTYRSELRESETITEGEWVSEAAGINSVVPISIATNIEDDLNVTVGDSLTFNVQGVQVATRIASIREVDFTRPEPNFFVVFPAGVLENAPQFFATVIQTDDDRQTTAIQQQVVRQHPNISAIDIGVALQSVQEFLDKIAMAVQFMALFSILTGFIVLGGSIAISRKQRTREAVLLRTLGADKAQISGIQTIEYALLGLLAGLTGLLLALIASWGLAWFYFDLAFRPDLFVLSIITGAVVLSAIVIGWSGSRHIFKHSPIEVLRLEGEAT